ncbi:MAG: FAD:protein FMN transferase, partial [Oligoflexus sp.]
MRCILTSLLSVLLLGAPCVYGSSPMPTAAVQVMEGRAQGTTYNIRYLGAPGKDLHAQVDQLLKDFDKVFSNYRPDSDISRFNAQDSL